VVTVGGGGGEDAVARSQRRRPHALARRTRRVVVRVNDAEFERLSSMAEQQGLSVARLMIRSTFSGGSVAAMRSQLVHDDVRGLIRLMGRQGVLLNQLTAATNSTGQAPLELEPTLRSMQRVIARTEALADSLDPSA